MHPTRQLDPVFPLSGGSSPRPQLRAPRLPAVVVPPERAELGLAATRRTWADLRRRATPFAGFPAAPATPG